MEEKKEAFRLKESIKEKAFFLNLPGFMYQELDKALSFMNYYKLKNIWDNLETFLDDLNSMKENYRTQIFNSFNKQK